MYLKALVGFKKVVEPDHPSSRSLRDRLRILDERMDNKALTGVEEPMNDLQSGPPHLGAKETLQESKRNKLLKKFKFRFKQVFVMYMCFYIYIYNFDREGLGELDVHILLH